MGRRSPCRRSNSPLRGSPGRSGYRWAACASLQAHHNPASGAVETGRGRCSKAPARHGVVDEAPVAPEPAGGLKYSCSGVRLITASDSILRIRVCIFLSATPIRGGYGGPGLKMEETVMSKKSRTSQQQQRDNRANQLNPNNDRYWQSRGQPGLPPSEHPSKSGSSPKAK